jgi:hypothetical protein
MGEGDQTDPEDSGSGDHWRCHGRERHARFRRSGVPHVGCESTLPTACGITPSASYWTVPTDRRIVYATNSPRLESRGRLIGVCGGARERQAVSEPFGLNSECSSLQANCPEVMPDALASFRGSWGAPVWTSGGPKLSWPACNGHLHSRSVIDSVASVRPSSRSPASPHTARSLQ